MKRRNFISLSVFSACSAFAAKATAQARQPLNVLFLTVDDMSCDSIGVFGCKVPETSPNIDRLAGEGIRFNYAHVQVGNCMPSRNVMQSGRYPHNNGVEGFYQVKDPKYPILPDLMKEHGYFVGIKAKVSHSTPYSPYEWDIVLEPENKKDQRNKDSFYQLTRQGIEAADAAGKPFYLVMNISDPHKPFYGMDNNQNVIDDPLKPTRIFTADDIVVPGFLPDTPEIRKELSHYYSSVRRADDCAGAALKALKESGHEQNTVLMFLSDHGMPLPFAKTTVWHHGTHTPWIVRWPGVTKAGTVDDHNMISAVDFTPTILDIVGIPNPGGMDGRSFLPLLKGEKQDGRDMIFKEYNENSGGNRSPMRSVQTRRFSYIFNPWSDGDRVFKTATTGTLSYKEMQRLAETDPAAAERLRVFDHRDFEELYDYENDPDALNNLINNPEYTEELERLRKALGDWMERTGDPMLPVYRNRHDKKVVDAYIKRVQQESDDRRKGKSKKQEGGGKPKQQNLLTLHTPKQVDAGSAVTIVIDHTIPAKLGEQVVQVTLKIGNNQKDRQLLKAAGTGKLNVTFEIPSTVPGGSVQFAAFVGATYNKSLGHIVSKPIPVK